MSLNADVQRGVPRCCSGVLIFSGWGDIVSRDRLDCFCHCWLEGTRMDAAAASAAIYFGSGGMK